MAKHPVPKRKTAKATTKQRYGSFQTKVLKRLTGEAQLLDCPNCGEKHKSHNVCHSCGQYRGMQILDKQKKIDKITTIKA